MRMVLYTYGCPRVGNQAFADDANRLMPNICWRIMNFFDVVVRWVGLENGYRHNRVTDNSILVMDN